MRRQMMTRLGSFLLVAWMVSSPWSRADNIRKLGATPLDSIEFEDTELGLALDYLSAKLKELHPDAPPVNFILIDPKGDLAKRRVTLRQGLFDRIGFGPEASDIEHQSGGTRSTLLQIGFVTYSNVNVPPAASMTTGSILA